MPVKNAILREITELEELTLRELRERWKKLYRAEPPRYSRTHLIKRLTYRIQEVAFGGLSGDVRSKLRDLAPAGKGGSPRLERRGKGVNLPALGTRFVREWRGERYEVTAVRGGFEYEGRRYRSLTAVAKAITGAHWNGRAFFGLKRGSKS